MPYNVLKSFLSSKLRAVSVDSAAYTFSLKSCVELWLGELGRAIHADAVKTGMNRDVYVGSALIAFHSRCGSAEHAHQVFDEMPVKDLVACTTLVSAYAQLSDSRARRAFEVVGCMQREGLDPNRVTLVSLLQAAGRIGALRLGCAIHCYAIRRGIPVLDEVLGTSLLDMYCKCGSRSASMLVFHSMKERSVAFWNVIFTDLVHSNEPLEAVQLFCHMRQDARVVPDQITLANMLLACNNLEYFRLSMCIHCYAIKTGLPDDLVMTTALIDAYSRCNEMKIARALFDELVERDAASYNVMISGYLNEGSLGVAAGLFNEMVKEHISPNSATFLCLLVKFADLEFTNGIRCIHGYIVRHGLHRVIEISNQLLHAYAKCGTIKVSRDIFHRMDTRDLVSWTTMVTACATSGYADEAISLFQLMQRAHKEPDTVAIVSLLHAVSHLGHFNLVQEIHAYIYRIHMARDVIVLNSLIVAYSKCGKLSTAAAVFDSIIDKKLASWNSMIAAYGIHGCFEEVFKLFHQIPTVSVQPDELTFSSLLSACSHTGRVHEGWEIFNSMSTTYGIAPNEDHCGCMVDLLARAGHIEQAFEFIKRFQLEKSVSALSALTSACGIYGNTKLGEEIGRMILKLEPTDSSNYTLLSNICAKAGNWNQAASLRSRYGLRGLQRMPGYSLIETDK